MPTTTLVIEEGTLDRDFLGKNKYSAQVAKGVATPGHEAKFNVVYQSTKLADRMTVSWTPKYALNWTTKIPEDGGKVTHMGKWQQCELGASYDLTSTGGWVINKNDSNSDPYSLNVGKNGYAQSVNIIVGILSEDTGAWQAYYVSPDKLRPTDGYGSYQPRDDIQIWYAPGIVTETMISTQSTEVEEFDMTGIELQYFWYDTAEASWKNSPTSFGLAK